MPVFPSTEWMDAFCVELAAHPRAADAGTRLRGVYRFVVDPGGPLTDRQTYEIRLEVAESGVRAHRVDNTASPRVVVQTDYDRWRQLLEGRLSLGPALLFGHLLLELEQRLFFGIH